MAESFLLVDDEEKVLDFISSFPLNGDSKHFDAYPQINFSAERVSVLLYTP
ncbi:hypothetical protein [Thermoactinomyces mirandus]|uniref:Uncharacterized protein n=1 Tax=Thermoactinomyces mirandus TaxID=2756294 RepID=A0A7W1XRJ7_9BACL|nr:hypothetical protein [Thermoactinomyces mirandus]MBA4602008.1 hypothetical protein [Thermoactinomyces mirandus]